MSEEVKQLINSPILWVITIVVITLVVILTSIMLVKSAKVAATMGITKKQIKDAMKASAISAVGPALVIMVGMISLMVMVGAPTAWMRLSVIGDISYELLSVGFAADAFGTTATPAAITPEIFQTTVFLMAFGCIGYLVIPMLFCNSFEKMLNRLDSNSKNKNKKITTIVSVAAVLGCYAYVDAPYLIARDASTVAMIAGFLTMLLIQRFHTKYKKKWLLTWGMLIAMSVGTVAGTIF